MTAIAPFALALLAGALSFSSPCCLPLMPGYVSYVSGVAGSGGTLQVRSRVLGAAALFVLGFSIVFTSLGAGASLFGPVLLRNRFVLTRVAGVLVLLMGLVAIGLLRIPFLFRELRVDLRRIRPGPLGAAPLGMAFAIGWTPCIGPVLAGILTAAATTASAVWGAALLFTYSLGLGIPFLLLAYACGRGGRLSAWLRRRGRAIELAGGAVLVLMGVLMITGQWLKLFIPLLRIYSRANWPPL
ncbi:MAG: cytochrome c biogenesis CcdA family protein [Actinomycetota bacterium]